MSVYLVRHALAGDADAWEGDDDRRPLTERGQRQARRLADTLADASVTRIITSPADRCVQTIDPLAAARGIAIEHSHLLDQDAGDLDAAMSLLLAACPDGVVACTHGEVVAELIRGLAAAGIDLAGSDADPARLRWEKGSVWVLDCDAGRFTRGRYVPPPARTSTPGAHTHPSFTANTPRPSR